MKNPYSIDENGFSLVELLIVVVIIGVLAGIAITSFAIYKDNAEYAKAESTYHHARVAMEAGAQYMEGKHFVDGWSGANGEPLGAPLADMLPAMAVPEKVKIHVSRVNCGFGGRTMDTMAVYACNAGLAKWWVKTCLGWEFQNKIVVGPGFC